MGILKLLPACKDYLWGGHRLAEEYGVEYGGPVLAEAWELSCHPDGPSIIANGPHRGKTLSEYIASEGWEILGTNCRGRKDFPILIKFIDAKQDLSIQVHPDNRYAREHEGQSGKMEMWYVLDAEEGASLYYGFKEAISEEEFEERIRENRLLEVLNSVPVHRGDTFFIAPGTLHSIGKGILLVEVQQNSNVTYRIYDYGRRGADGKPRDLHIEKALAVTHRGPAEGRHMDYPHVAECEYFIVDHLSLNGKTLRQAGGKVGEESFLSILVLHGAGTVRNGAEEVPFRQGDSFFLPAGSGEWRIEGKADVILTRIPGAL